MEEEQLRGHRRALTGKEARGTSRRSACRSSRTPPHADPGPPPRPELDHLVSDRIQPEQHPRPAIPTTRGRTTRSSARSRSRPAATELYILCQLDRQNVTGNYLAPGLQHPGRAAPAGRRLRLQPPGGPEVRPADPRAPARGGGRLQVPAGDPARRPGHVGPVDQLRDPRPGDHRGGRPGLQGEGGRAPDQDPPGRQPAGEPRTRRPLQEEKIGPTLGEDTIAKGVRAIWVSMLVVPIFMIVYYRFAGVVAVVALVLNMILLVGVDGLHRRPRSPCRAWPAWR